MNDIFSRVTHAGSFTEDEHCTCDRYDFLMNERADEPRTKKIKAETQLKLLRATLNDDVLDVQIYDRLFHLFFESEKEKPREK